MTAHDLDLFVLGAGSGGVRAARVAASLGARVAICEERYLGGTCDNAGCIPNKLFVYGAELGHGIDDARAYGWRVEAPRFDWQTLRDHKDREIARLNSVYARLLDEAGVGRVEGHGRLIDAHTVEVKGERFSAKHVLIATGSWPTKPDIPGAELGVTSNEMFHLDALPGRAIVVGGGYIAVEFASILRGLGVDTTLCYRRDRLLRGFDTDVRDAITAALGSGGITLALERDLRALEVTSGALRLHVEPGPALDADLVLFATGRAPLIEGLGLDAAGVRTNARGEIAVDAHLRTSAPSVYAVGDVIGRYQLTPVAIAEGMHVAHALFGDRAGPMRYDTVPTAVFGTPAVATVGLTEAEARARAGREGGAVRVYRSRFRPLKHTLTGRETQTMMKLVVDDASDRVLGCHIVGEHAAEILQGFAVAIHAGATKAQLDETVGIHPTAAEELVTMRTPVT